MQRASALALPLALIYLTLISSSGCGGPSSSLAPVTGRVTLDGQPLAGVTVCFVRDGSPNWSFGQTDADGKFALTTITDKDGAYLGNNQVTVSQPAAGNKNAAKSPAGVPSPTEYFEQLAKSEATKSAVVPERYQLLGASGLSAEIKVGKNVVDLPLVTAAGSAQP